MNGNKTINILTNIICTKRNFWFPKLSLLILSAVVLGTASFANATIINGPNIGGYTTFQDLSTGRTWLDLNNFFNQSYSRMAATATSLGLTLATEADVLQLVSTLPLTGGQWSTYASIMGSAPNRELIWGGYADPGTGAHGWAWSNNGDISWNDEHQTQFRDNQVENHGGPYADMNIWAYTYKIAGVPDTGSSGALLCLAFTALAGLRRKFCP